MGISHSHNGISVFATIILAAGQSKRMGEQKLLLPWGDSTVIESVVDVFRKGGCRHIIIVTGASQNNLLPLFSKTPGIIFVHNRDFAQTEMLQSLQLGLQMLPKDTDAFFIALGDQPQIDHRIVDDLRSQYLPEKQQIIIPSHAMKRGHPWLVSVDYAREILELPKDKSLRDFLSAHETQIVYVNTGTNEILKDLDTPQDYERDRPK